MSIGRCAYATPSGRALGSAGWVGGKVMRLICEWDFDRTTRAAGRLMRAIGPRLHGHRVARANLKIAFPYKSDAESRTCWRLREQFRTGDGRICISRSAVRLRPARSAQKRIVIEPATMSG